MSGADDSEHQLKIVETLGDLLTCLGARGGIPEEENPNLFAFGAG